MSDEELMRWTSVGYFLGMLCMRCDGERGERRTLCMHWKEERGGSRGPARGATEGDAGVEDVVTSVV
jgi:hypothetical protein